MDIRNKTGVLLFLGKGGGIFQLAFVAETERKVNLRVAGFYR